MDTSILEKHRDGRLFISDIWSGPTSDQLDMVMEGRVQHTGYVIFLRNLDNYCFLKLSSQHSGHKQCDMGGH